MSEEKNAGIVRSLREVEANDEDVIWTAEQLHGISESETRAILADLDRSPETEAAPESVKNTDKKPPGESDTASSPTRKINRKPAIVLGVVLLAVAGFMLFANYQQQKAKDQAYFNEMMYRAAQQREAAAEANPYEFIDNTLLAENRQLPKVEGRVTVEKAVREGKRITYYATFNDMTVDDVDIELSRVEMQETIQRSLCQQKRLSGLDEFFRQDFIFEYAYAGNDGRHIISIEVSPANCQ